MTRTLLIDGDIVVYQACANTEEEWVDEDNSLVAIVGHPDKAQCVIAEQLEKIKATLNGDDLILCFTDGNNWRKSVLPSYKENRKGSRKPLGYYIVRDWVMSRYQSFLRPTLEGDDCLGILATHPKLIKGEKVIVSEDKDMKTIPALFCHRLDQGILDVSKEDADIWHMAQTLAGDTTDGYTGCTGVGMETAMKYLKAGLKVEPYEHTLTRGPRKGEKELRYKDVPANNLWEIVVSLYEKNGLTEADALVQARCARILQYTDYDFKKKEVILWNPNTTS